MLGGGKGVFQPPPLKSFLDKNISIGRGLRYDYIVKITWGNASDQKY